MDIAHREKIKSNVRLNTAAQSTPECRENYLKSCEVHGGDLAIIAQEVRKEYEPQTN